MQQIPTPPSDEEKYLYLDAPKFFLYIGGLTSMLTLVSGMYLFSLQGGVFLIYTLFPVLLTFYLSLSYFIGIFGDTFKEKEIQKANDKDLDKSIDVFLPSCGEERGILANTMHHVSNLDWKDLRVHVLDDSKDAEHNAWLKNLAEHYKFNYISRENKGELKKAGNIRNAFKQTDADFFLILDADFAPRKDMLKEMIPYMRDEKVAILQTPQFFEIKETDSEIRKGAAYVQELFYRLIQINRQKWNGSICVGTCALYRRSSLAHRGGTAAIEHSEDVHTGFFANCDGYKVKYVPMNLAKGVCPDTITAYIVQQYRWATGSISLFLNKEFWKSPLTKMTKLCYISGMVYYVSTGLGVFITPLPGIVMMALFPEKVIYYNAIFTIPSLIYGTMSLAIWSKAPWGTYALEARVLSYWSHILAIYDKLRNQTVAWVATGDKNVVSNTKQIYGRFKRVYITWNVFLAVSIISLFVYNVVIRQCDWYDFIPSLINLSLELFIFQKVLRDL